MLHPRAHLLCRANPAIQAVQVLDASSLRELCQVQVGDFPVGVALTPSADCLYVSNYFGGTVSILDVSAPRQPQLLPR